MLFSTAKKIEELQAKLQAAIDENETLKANAAAAQAELDAVNATFEAVSAAKKSEEDEDEDDDKMEKAKKSKEHEDEEVKKSAAAKVAELKASFDGLTTKVAALESSLESKVSAAVSATLAKIGIDPIHAGVTADGTKPAEEKPKGRNGIERAGALLNEKIKAKQ
jgi:chromosome segregation ATPase